MEFNPTTAIPIVKRPDGLYEKNSFNPSTAKPIKETILRSDPNPRYRPPLTEKQRAEAFVELTYKEKGQDVPWQTRVDWVLTSPTARMITSNVIGGILTSGIVPAYNAIKGVANASSPNSDIGKMIFDSAYKGLAENQEVDNLGAAAAKADPERNWVISGLMGATAEMLIFMPSLINKAGESLLSTESQINKAFNNLRNSPKWPDYVNAISKKVGKPPDVVEASLISKFNESKPEMIKHFNKGDNYFKLLSRNLRESTGVDILSERGSVRIGQKVGFDSGNGLIKYGKIKELQGERAIIDLEGREVVATLSQLSVPEMLEKNIKTNKLETVNPSGSVFVSYDPMKRQQMPLADNITTLDKTMNKSPDETITIYRGVPKGYKEIVPGDYITTNKQLAKDYAGSGDVIEKNIKLSDILDDKNEPLGEEYIYRPKSLSDNISEPPKEPPKESPPASPEYEENRKLSKIIKKSTAKKDLKDFIDKTFIPLSTRLSKIDESLRDAIRQHTFNVNMKTKADMDASTPFLKSIQKMNKEDAIDLDFALKNSDKEVIDSIVNKYGLEKEYSSVQSMLKETLARAKDAGIDMGDLGESYWPRRISDLEGYLKYLRGTDNWGAISKKFSDEEKLLGRPLKEEEKAEIINSMVRGYGKEKIPLNKPGNVKERKIVTLTPEMNRYYKDSGVALTDYIRSMNDNIEARKFFGKEKNLENSIGNYVSKLIDDKIISPEDEENVRQILKSYFDKRGTRGIVTGFKNFSYIASMGSPISAITQIGDLAFSLYENGFYGTVKAMAGKKKISKQDIGLDLIAEEFSDQSNSAKALSRVFKMIGLDAMDSFGKEVLINGTLEKLSKQAIKEDAKLVSELHRVFPQRSAQVLEDLKNQNPTDDVKYILFSRLADYQPIALSEMPEYYVRGGNLRLFYMLKSYTIKQIDVFHNKVFREEDAIKKAQNAFKLAVALALTGATADTVKDILLGRKTKLEDLVIDNMLKLVGFSKWQLYKTRQDGLFQTMLESILPPVPFIDDLYKDAMKMTNKKKPKIENMRIWQRIPVVGKLYYWWFGGGREIEQKKNKSKKTYY